MTDIEYDYTQNYEWIKASRGPSSVRLVALSARQIADILCAHYAVSFDDIMSDKRLRPLVRCRVHIYHALRTELQWSFNRIARYIGRDRTTVRGGYLNHLKRIETGIVQDIVFPKGKW